MKTPMAERLRNIHPGEVLLEEFLAPLGLSQNALARALGVPPRRVPRGSAPRHRRPHPARSQAAAIRGLRLSDISPW